MSHTQTHKWQLIMNQNLTVNVNIRTNTLWNYAVFNYDYIKYQTFLAENERERLLRVSQRVNNSLLSHRLQLMSQSQARFVNCHWLFLSFASCLMMFGWMEREGERECYGERGRDLNERGEGWRHKMSGIPTLSQVNGRCVAAFQLFSGLLQLLSFSLSCHCLFSSKVERKVSPWRLDDGQVLQLQFSLSLSFTLQVSFFLLFLPFSLSEGKRDNVGIELGKEGLCMVCFLQ